MPERSNKNKSFEVYINEGEMYQIQEWVLKHKDIETGGDLFGLWLDDHTAVVQFVLGPGKKCRRTTTSFFQDVEYLQEAGSYLTDKHGLCNIGQWHSHHRLSLSKPSHGDENTVWGNMPVLGLNRYIVFIANITNEVKVNCFLFRYQGRKRSLTKGQFKSLHGNSPLRLNGMVLQNTFDGLESFINPDMFESEMKFLRNSDSNKEYRDRAPATPEKIDNLNAKSPKQPHETATLESQRLRDNNTKDDESRDIMITGNIETCTRTMEQFGNTSVYNQHDSKNSLPATITFRHEQNDRNISRRNKDEKDKLDIFNANCTGNKRQDDASISVKHKKPTIRHNNAKDNVNILNKGNVKTEIETIVRPNTDIFTAHEQHNGNYLRPDSDDKQNSDTLKHDVFETWTSNIPVGHEQNNGNISNEDDAKDNDILNDDNAGTFTENTEQYDTRVSAEDRQDNRNSLRSDNDTKDNNDTLKKDNIETCTGDKKQYDTSNYVVHEQYNWNSLRRNNDAKDNNILTENKTRTLAESTEHHDTSVFVEDGQNSRNYFRPENDANDNNNILKDKNIKAFTGNTEQNDISSFVDHGKSMINKTVQLENHKAKSSCEKVNKVNNGSQTKKETAGTPKTKTVEKEIDFLSDNDVKKHDVFGHRKDIETIRGYREQSNANIPDDYGKYHKNSLDNVRTSIVNKEHCETSDEHEQYYPKESPQKLVFKAGHLPQPMRVNQDRTRSEQSTPKNQSPKESNHEVPPKNSYEPEEESENYKRKSSLSVQSYNTPEREQAIRNYTTCERNLTQKISRRARNKVAPDSQTAPSTSVRSPQNYNRGAKSKNTHEPNFEGKTPRTRNQVLENKQSLQHQRTPISTMTSHDQKSVDFSNISPGARDMYPNITERVGVNYKFSKEREHIGYEHERPMSNSVSRRNIRPTQIYHVSKSGNEIVNVPRENRQSGQYDNAINNSELLQDERRPNPGYKLPKIEHQAIVGKRQNARKGTIQAKESGREEVQNKKKGDETPGNKTPLGRVDVKDISNIERRQQIGLGENKSSISKIVSQHYIKQTEKTVVTYDNNESGAEIVNGPSQNRGSRQSNVKGNNGLPQYKSTPRSEDKVPPTRNQAEMVEKPNTLLRRIQADKNPHEVVEDTKQDDKTQKKNINCFPSCFGKKSRQISDEPDKENNRDYNNSIFV